MEKQIGFVIDTNEYSGNFERELCAYITGHVGECEVGEEYADMYLSEFGTALVGVQYKSDEYNCLRPVEIYPTPNKWNNGVGEHFENGQEGEALKHYKKYYKRDKLNSILHYEKIKDKASIFMTIEEIDKEINKLKESIRKLENLTTTDVKKYPAYESVVIYFDEPLEEFTINQLKERTKDFFNIYNKQWEKDVRVLGFRIIEE